MAHDEVKFLDVVALTIDLPESNLFRGQVGMVVDILAGGEAFEVEFSTRDGRTYESLGLRRDRLMVLHFEPISPDSIPDRSQLDGLRDKRKSNPGLLSSLKNLGRDRRS